MHVCLFETPPGLYEHTASYLDWTVYTRRLLYEQGQKKKQLQYWKSILEDLPVLDLPLDHARPLVLSSRGSRIPVLIPPELTAQLIELMTKSNSNLFVGLLSLYMSLLHIWGGGDKFSIGVAMANRQHEGIEHLVGYFANECPIVADFKHDPSFIDFVGRIRKNVLDAMANSDVPFHEVCEELRVDRSSSRTSVFQAMFALQERHWHSVDDLLPKEEEQDITFNIKQYSHNTSKFEVHLQLRHDKAGGLEGDFHIATDLFTVETGMRLVEAFTYLMKACVDNPNKSITR
jgi:non-ribosomal peptide synthetase component F